VLRLQKRTAIVAPGRQPAAAGLAGALLFKVFLAEVKPSVREVMEDFEHDEPTDALIWMEERIDALAKQHKTTDPKFVPHPATWLGQGRYLDPVETP
jgi:hypothetical protein